MEHRWGWRYPVDLPVRLVRTSGVVTWGRLCNLSVTGAFIESSPPPPPNSLVYVERAGGGHWPPSAAGAYVIWQKDNGIGLEWCEPTEYLAEALTSPELRGFVARSSEMSTTLAQSGR